MLVTGGIIMMWGMFTWHGLSLLVKLNAPLNGDHYITLLLNLFMECVSQQELSQQDKTKLKSSTIGLKNSGDP